MDAVTEAESAQSTPYLAYKLLLRGVTYFLALFLFSCVNWLNDSFDSPSLQQIVYHLYFFESLVADADSSFLIIFLIDCILAPAVIAAIILFAERLIDSFRDKQATLKSFAVSRSRFYNLQLSRTAILPACALGASAFFVSYKLSAFDYFNARFQEDVFSKYYLDPANVQLQPAALKNLIIIYVESLETAYSDEQLFGRDLLRKLNSQDGVSFESYRTANSADWTIAAMVATQCGVPLQLVVQLGRTQSEGNSGHGVDAFLQNAKCLSDILHENGYRNVFMGGAPLSFAGKLKFLRRHHYDEAYGHADWEKVFGPTHQYSEWGLYDHELFAKAKTKLKELQSKGAPFQLSILTLDMHHPKGHYSTHCVERGASAFEDIVECTAEEVANFINFVRDNGYLKNTNIVVIGDHLAMPNTVWAKLQSASVRRIFNRFISTEPIAKNTNDLIPFDMFPTLLEFAGIRVVGNRLALGYSAIGSAESPKPPGDRPEAFLGTLEYSAAYRRLWKHAD